ncbi:hypothetical protein SRA_07386 [Streptococcus ratti FA-1 = DSM 20564]|uniref:Uncharacterized protein n=1 Tax=Streptococcus ratti FA-1 = DSM 20564 TaxID=699248 RepID=A0ABN0GV22_STRRT|nr:hypothetical protein SRA_07386 [Streptococcus ratti FA-1 = DSM 20564]
MEKLNEMVSLSNDFLFLPSKQKKELFDKIFFSCSAFSLVYE